MIKQNRPKYIFRIHGSYTRYTLEQIFGLAPSNKGIDGYQLPVQGQFISFNRISVIPQFYGKYFFVERVHSEMYLDDWGNAQYNHTIILSKRTKQQSI